MSLNEILTDLVPSDRITAVPQSARDPGQSLIADRTSQIRKTVPDILHIEGIIALHPDLVIMQVHDPAMVQTLRDMGIPVFATKVPVNLEQVKMHIQSVASAVGEPTRGEETVQILDDKVRRVQRIVNRIPQDRRRILMAYSSQGIFGSREGLFHDICTQAGVRNGAAMAGLVRNEHVSKEKLIEINPDVLLLPDPGSSGQGNESKIEEEILGDPSLRVLKAVQNHQIARIKDRYRYAASQYMGDAVWIIASNVYPDYFEGKDINRD
jgi:iron complex transport system substrate-binding protein